MPDSGRGLLARVGRLLLIGCPVVLLGTAAAVWAGVSTGDETVVSVLGSWWFILGIAAALGLLLAGLILIGSGRGSKQARSDAPLVEESPSESAKELSTQPSTDPVPPRQPVVPAEHAQGYGWMRASDLADGADGGERKGW